MSAEPPEPQYEETEPSVLDLTRRPATRVLGKDNAQQLPQPSKRGRPSKMTDERQDMIIDALRAGNYLATAAAYAGVARSTLHDWRQQHPDFAEAVEEARAQAEARNVAIIQTAAQTQWQAAAWWLERSFPERWGRRSRAEHDHAGGVGITLTQLVKLASEEEDEVA